MIVNGVMLETESDGRDVVTVWLDGRSQGRVVYSGFDKEAAHRFHMEFLMKLPHWRSYMASIGAEISATYLLHSDVCVDLSETAKPPALSMVSGEGIEPSTT